MIPGRTTNTIQPYRASYGEMGMMLIQNMESIPKPSQDLITFIQQNTDNTYNWNLPVPNQLGTISNSPFLPKWNTGDYSSGFQRLNVDSLPSVTVQAGFHLPISPGVAVGPNFSYGTNSGSPTVSPDVALGSIADAGVNIGLYGDSRYSSPVTINFGLGKYLGVQITPSNATSWLDRQWYYPNRYINGISLGLGIGISTPINASTDPSYQYQDKK